MPLTAVREQLETVDGPVEWLRLLEPCSHGKDAAPCGGVTFIVPHLGVADCRPTLEQAECAVSAIVANARHA